MGEGVRVVAASESARAVTAGEARRQRAPRLDGGASVGAVWAPAAALDNGLARTPPIWSMQKAHP